MAAPRDNSSYQMTKTVIKDYVKRDDPAFYGPLQPIYLGKPMFRCSGGFAIVRKTAPFAVCIPADFAMHVAQAFKRKEDVDAAIKECLGKMGADGRYLCALWDVTEDDGQDLPAEENFVDGGDLGRVLGENWITYKLFLQWDPLSTVVVPGVNGNIWVSLYDYQHNQIGKVCVDRDIDV
ncbi:hypothetical protein KJ359_012090 [Pestalotiopsis sp. 9143b]|nr:hypothetical protein KJ359_012090 [Pestalotiopsis sp. 9143b]